MNKKILIPVILIIIVLLGGIGYWIYQSKIQQTNNPVIQTVLDPRNATYMIEREKIILVNGRAEKQSAPGSASTTITQYFGNEVRADYNFDGITDAAFLLTQTTGGSGTFYYVATVLSTGNTFAGTNAIFLGDRIAPQTTQFQGREIIVNYADRKPDEPMTTPPSIGVSRYFKVSEGQLIEVTK